jgi:hypothetical protein
MVSARAVRSRVRKRHERSSMQTSESRETTRYECKMLGVLASFLRDPGHSLPVGHGGRLFVSIWQVSSILRTGSTGDDWSL